MRIINGKQSGLLSDKEFTDMLKEFPIEQRKKFIERLSVEIPEQSVEIYKSKEEKELERLLYFSRCIIKLKKRLPFFKKYRFILRQRIWNYFYNHKFWKWSK